MRALVLKLDPRNSQYSGLRYLSSLSLRRCLCIQALYSDADVAHVGRNIKQKLVFKTSAIPEHSFKFEKVK